MLVNEGNSTGLGRSSIWLAVTDLLKPKAKRLWQKDGKTETLNYDGAEVRVQIQDEAGKIDLNAAEQALLEGSLRSTGIGETQIRKYHPGDPGSETIFQKIRPALTIHSHLPGLNSQIAVRKALLALPGSDAIAIDDFM